MDTNTEQLSIIAGGWLHKDTPSFEELSTSILQPHLSAQASAIKAVNQMATLRNWLIGCYIVEYEQKLATERNWLLFILSSNRRIIWRISPTPSD